MKKIGLMVLLGLLVSGCATTSNEVKGQYVSPYTYQDYDCERIAQEEQRIRRKLKEVASAVDKDAQKSQSAQAIGWVLFWPAFFFAGQDKAIIAELGKLKGEYEAVEDVSIQKSCDVQFVSIQEELEKQKEE